MGVTYIRMNAAFITHQLTMNKDDVKNLIEDQTHIILPIEMIEKENYFCRTNRYVYVCL